MMQISLVDHFQLLARYNRGANRRLYDCCAKLAPKELNAARPAFFNSIIGTLNHILIGDRIWLARFDGATLPSTNLDAVVYGDFETLRRARLEEDDRIDQFAAHLTPGFLGQIFVYVNNEGRRMSDPAHLLLSHFFNHQTHHRGQVTDLLMQTDVDPPVLDMHRVINP